MSNPFKRWRSRGDKELNVIKIGDVLPSATLMEFVEMQGEACAAGPQSVDIREAAAGKTIALFAVPGAFTPTCSNQHLPGYLHHAAALREAGVDEIWCVAVNDPFVMGAWVTAQATAGKVRMLADGDAAFARATGLTWDLTGKGLGLRSARYSMLLKNGVVTRLNVESPGKFEVSDALTLLEQLKH